MQDRVPLYPGRVTLTPVSGQANTFDLTRADQPTQEGTPLNKASLLKDATAALFGKTNAAVPDDILSLLSKSALAEVTEKYTKHVTLNDFPVGKTIFLNENGNPVEFYVAKHNYENSLNGMGRTLVVRKDCYDTRAWHSSNVNAYASSAIDSWLNSTYKNLLDADVRGVIGTTKIKYTPGNGNTTVGTLERAIFLLSVTELGGTVSYANTEGTALDIASALQIAYMNGSAITQWTRSPRPDYITYACCLNVSGGVSNSLCDTTYGARPAFTLPVTFPYTWYTDSSGNIYTEQEYETKITDVLGNLIAIPAGQIKDGVKLATGSYTGTGTYGESHPNSLTFDFEPKFLSIGLAKEDGNGYVVPNTNFLLMSNGGFACKTNAAIYGKVDGNTVYWYSGSSADNQLNTDGYEFTYIAIG